jgi:hypothetical protein
MQWFQGFEVEDPDEWLLMDELLWAYPQYTVATLREEDYEAFEMLRWLLKKKLQYRKA